MKPAALALLLAAAPAAAETLDGRLQAIDGDTIWHYPAGSRVPEKIRLLDIDAPETRQSACEAELVAGLRAKARVVELLARRPVSVERCERHGGACTDRYGRTLARLRLADGRELGAVLISERLALPYLPGRKRERNAHWCGGRG